MTSITIMLRHSWHHTWITLLASTGIATLSGVLIAISMPRGPITSAQTIGLMVLSPFVGLLVGLLTRSRWAMLLAPFAQITAFELVRWGTPGPTVSSFQMDSAYAILAFLLGRVLYIVAGLLPLLLGTSVGAALARQISDGSTPSRTTAGRLWLFARRSVKAIAAVGLMILAILIALPASTPEIVSPDGTPVAGSIATMEAIRLGGQEQWITIRGHSTEKPVLLSLAGGPGQSDLPYARVLWHDLERDFVVVDWDQRGTGKSYPALDPTSSLTLERAVADTIELSEYLRERFDERKIYLHGESWGSSLGVLAVQRRPDLYYALITSGQMVSQRETDRRLYHDTLDLAARTGDEGLAKTMHTFGEPPYSSIFPYALVMQQYDRLYKPHTLPDSTLERGPLLAQEAGPWGVFGREYSLVERVNVLRGLMDMFTVMYPQLQDLDFRRDVPRLEVPFYMLDGEAELTARRDLALEWFDQLEAPLKRRVSFANGTHSVAFEHFEAFHQLMTDTVLPETYEHVTDDRQQSQVSQSITMDAPALAFFFDQLIPAQLERQHIPGAVVVVVQDGSLVFARGYGWADVEQRRPVIPDQTLFHIGSNTKLFTWTAVMQLVEQGRLDLDEDVNTYLDFRIPHSYPEPITLRHLMTHTSGFENRDYGVLARDPTGVTPLAEWLPSHLPARVRPSGTEIGYSNYGSALAGYIVERVVGMPYEEYIEEHLLEPLEMRRSTVRQEVPPSLAADVARGYVTQGDGFREEPLYTYQGPPAGAMRATATDIGNFMVAHLQQGRFGNRSVLQADTAQLMHQTAFRPDSRVNGMAHGVWEMDRNGVRIVGHLGSAAPLHYSLLALLPDEGVGLFVAYNGDTARPLTVNHETLAAFCDYLYPAPVAALVPPHDFARRAGQFTGEYRRNNFGGSYTTVEKARRILGEGTRQIVDAGDGTLEVITLGGTERFVEVESDFFREVGGREAVVFFRDQQGKVTKAFFSGSPAYTYERVPLVETPSFSLTLLVMSMVLFGATLLVATVAGVIGLRRSVRPDQSRYARPARWTAGTMAGVNLLLVAGLTKVLGDANTLAGDFSRLQNCCYCRRWPRC